MLMYMGTGAALAAYRRDGRIRDLIACSRACDEAARSSSDRPGSEGQGAPSTFRSLVECRELCTLTAGLMARGSDLAAQAFPACIEACRACAEACERGGTDEALRECALLCRAGERACRAALGAIA